VHVATFIPAEVGLELLNVMMVRVLQTGGDCRYRALAVLLPGMPHLTRLRQVSHHPQMGFSGWPSLPHRGVFDKSHNRLASSARRLVIEAAYPL
jgi:hypothetical protein